MNIWNALPSPVRYKIIKSIQKAFNNLILHMTGANDKSAFVFNSLRVVLNKTAIEVLLMKLDIESLIMSAICIYISKELSFNAEDRVKAGANDNDYEHDAIHRARSHAQ
jgi:hypothetical protein